MAAESARSEQRRPAHGESGDDDVPARLAGERTNPVELDRLIHGRVRLGIVSALAVNDSLGFSELRDLLETSDGNLSVHARRLEEAGYISCTKSFAGRMPHTEYQLTDSGRQALEKYLAHMEALIDRVRES